MPSDNHWMDDRSKDTAFNRKKADLRVSRTRMPVSKPPGNVSPRQFGTPQPSGLESSTQHFAIPSAQPQSQSQAQGNDSWQQSAPQSAPPAAPNLTQEEIDALAMVDPQSQVFNLRYIARRMAYEFERAQHFGRTLGIAVVSIDKLQTIGLEYGPTALDSVIGTVSTFLVNAFRSVDLVGRFTESRFVVVCPEITPEEIKTIAHHVCAACSAFELKHQWHTFKFTVSIGIAISSKELTDVESLLAVADLGADDATESGGNAICFEG
jgi:diguanylate cyclase (GGDEF)-like protein